MQFLLQNGSKTVFGPNYIIIAVKIKYLKIIDKCDQIYLEALFSRKPIYEFLNSIQ